MDCPYARNSNWCDHKGSHTGNRGDQVRCRFKDITKCPLLRETESKAVSLQFLEDNVTQSSVEPKRGITE